MDANEMALLQGFNLCQMTIPQGTSQRQIAACLGNTISVSVISKIMVRALYVARLITTQTYRKVKDTA